MKVNLISSVAGVAALLASPAMAMENWPQASGPSHTNVYRHSSPYAAPQGMAYAPHGATHVAPRVQNEFGPYTPSKPVPRYGTNGDFQSGGGDK